MKVEAKTLQEIGFSKEQINLIWDFYVIHTLGGGSELSRKVTDYGWKTTTGKKEGYPALLRKLAESANIEKFCIIKVNKTNETLKKMNLSPKGKICIEHPRAVMNQNYGIKLNENEIIEFDHKESKVAALFRHIRNALAHGRIYCFENGNILLEDKDGRTATVEILIQKHALLDWIFVVDKDHKYYSEDILKEENNGTFDS
ncbi:MAG: hypothetical protein UDB11_05890 [Peptococcaceae bacterium]|nr:hypothetical protein [Peptococcaceae bacterium]